MISSNTELEFIGRQHMKLSNSKTFWIGGATMAMGTISLSPYMLQPACEGGY